MKRLFWVIVIVAAVAGLYQAPVVSPPPKAQEEVVIDRPVSPWRA